MPKKGNNKKAAGLGITSAQAIRLASRNEKSAGVDPYHYATLVYPFLFTTSGAVGNSWSWQFRLNSLYDPDYTGSGSQPTTFDQWMALYDRYRVLATTVDMNVANQDSTNGGYPSIVMAMAPGIDPAPVLTFAGIAGLRDARQSTFAKNYGNTAHLHATYVMKDVMGVDEEAMMSELQYAGTSSSSASAAVYLSVAGWVKGATDAIVIHGRLSFAVRFEQPHSNNVSAARAALPEKASVTGASGAGGVVASACSIAPVSPSMATYTAGSPGHCLVCGAEAKLVFDPSTNTGRRFCVKCSALL